MKSFLLSVSFSLLALNIFAGGIEKIIPRATKPQLHFGMMKDLPKYNHERDGRGLLYMYVPFNSTALNNYLEAQSSVHGSFDNNYMMIGLDDVSNNGKHSDIIGCFGIMLPQKVNAGPADSVQLRLSGWHHTFSFLAWDFIPGETVALAIGTAWSYGNLKMRRTINGQKTRYTNPFVAPGARAEFRLTFGNFYFGGRTTYRYDLTHELWKRKNDMMPVLPEYDNSGMAYFGYIGLIL